MNRDEEDQAGWPLGLERLSLRVHIMNALSGGDINSLRMSTPSFSSISSSDFDTESTLSFFPDKSNTLGNLIGIRSNRRIRHASNSVHPEDKTKISQMGITARAPRSYGRVTSWKPFAGCLPLNPRQHNGALSLADLLKAEKRDGASVVDSSTHKKLDTSAIYGRINGVLPSGTNSLFLDGHMVQSSSVNSKGLAAVDLAMTRQTSPILTNMNNLQDWDSSRILQGSCEQNTAHRQSFCMPWVSDILFKPSQSRGSSAGNLGL